MTLFSFQTYPFLTANNIQMNMCIQIIPSFGNNWTCLFRFFSCSLKVHAMGYLRVIYGQVQKGTRKCLLNIHMPPRPILVLTRNQNNEAKRKVEPKAVKQKKYVAVTYN